ncbi:hypothetical protein V6N13_100931 [Hibiscus sabdariffa]
MLLGDSHGVLNPQDVVSGEQSLLQSVDQDSVIPEVVMEAPIVSSGPSQVGLQPLSDGLPSKPVSASYAHMVAKNLRNDGESRVGGVFAQDKVFVLEDDFVIDRAGVMETPGQYAASGLG